MRGRAEEGESHREQVKEVREARIVEERQNEEANEVCTADDHPLQWCVGVAPNRPRTH